MWNKYTICSDNPRYAINACLYDSLTHMLSAIHLSFFHINNWNNWKFKDDKSNNILSFRTVLQIQYRHSSWNLSPFWWKKNTRNFLSMVWTSLKYQKFQYLCARLQELYLYCICNAYMLYFWQYLLFILYVNNFIFSTISIYMKDCCHF